jgi:hypothetical protein
VHPVPKLPRTALAAIDCGRLDCAVYVKPGNLLWTVGHSTANIAGSAVLPGDEVTYQATIDLPFDADSSNDTATLTVTAGWRLTSAAEPPARAQPGAAQLLDPVRPESYPG